jgi:hypothetical protein
LIDLLVAATARASTWATAAPHASHSAAATAAASGPVRSWQQQQNHENGSDAGNLISHSILLSLTTKTGRSR